MLRNCLLALFLMLPLSALAALPEDEETDFPITIEDASATDKGETDIRFVSRYEHDHGDERFTVVPELEYGVAKDVELNVTLPFDLGSADDDHGGELGVEALYGFVDERENFPALAVSGRANLPTGDNSRGVDTTARFLATKHIFRDLGLNAVHFNAGWMHNAGANDEERDDRYQFVVGSSHGLTDKTALITDLVREQGEESGDHASIIELGLRHEIADETIGSIGAGAGLGEESPDIRVTVGIQKTFE